MINKNYIDFVLNYKPFEWEINESEFRENYKNKHNSIIDFKRFYKIFLYLEKLKEQGLKNPKILDVGAFPGNMVMLSKFFFEDISEYYSIGLDLNEKFIKKMQELNVKCINTEIDPQFPEAKQISNWNIKNFNVCFLLDTIEHLVDPIFCLDEINKSLKSEGYLLITTDNITNFLYIADMIRKGKSPNVHPILSSMVYRGNHRPHHREFSKEELEFILQRCGFSIIEHEYFDRQQGYYFIDRKKNCILRHKIKKTPKNLLHNLIKNVGFLVPHLRNHHIILAKKVKNNEEVIKNRQITSSTEEWNKIRRNILKI